MESEGHSNSTGSTQFSENAAAYNLISLIRTVSVIFHSQIVEDQSSVDELSLCAENEIFNEERYIKARPDEFSEERLALLRAVPTADQIFDFLKTLYDCAQLSLECSVVSLIYINRLIAFAEMRLHATNWRPLVLCGLLIAQKVCEQNYLRNEDFAYIYPFFTLKEITCLEEKFLELIAYNIDVKTSVYGKYYSHLRTLYAEKSEISLSALDIIAAKRLEMRSTELKARLEAAVKAGQLALSFPGVSSKPKALTIKPPLKFCETA